MDCAHNVIESVHILHTYSATPLEIFLDQCLIYIYSKLLSLWYTSLDLQWWSWVRGYLAYVVHGKVVLVYSHSPLCWEFTQVPLDCNNAYIINAYMSVKLSGILYVGWPLLCVMRWSKLSGCGGYCCLLDTEAVYGMKVSDSCFSPLFITPLPLSFSPLSSPLPRPFPLISLLPQYISIAVVGENKDLEIYDNEKINPFVSFITTVIVWCHNDDVIVLVPWQCVSVEGNGLHKGREVFRKTERWGAGLEWYLCTLYQLWLECCLFFSLILIPERRLEQSHSHHKRPQWRHETVHNHSHSHLASDILYTYCLV